MKQSLASKDVKKIVDKSIDNLTIDLFKYFDVHFKEIDRKFEKTYKMIHGYSGAVDAFAKQSEAYMQEMLALGHKVDRLEKWIQKIAQETGVKLEY